MQIKIRVCGETANGKSTWAELCVAVHKPWIALTGDAAADFIKGVHLRPANARLLSAALLAAADAAERGEDPPEEEIMPAPFPTEAQAVAKRSVAKIIRYLSVHLDARLAWEAVHEDLKADIMRDLERIVEKEVDDMDPGG